MGSCRSVLSMSLSRSTTPLALSWANVTKLKLPRPLLNSPSAFMPFGDRGAVFDHGRSERDVILLQGQADDGPRHPLARLHLVLEGPVADEAHAHAGPVGRGAGVEPPFQAWHRFTDEGIHCLQVRFPGGIGV